MPMLPKTSSTRLNMHHNSTVIEVMKITYVCHTPQGLSAIALPNESVRIGSRDDISAATSLGGGGILSSFGRHHTINHAQVAGKRTIQIGTASFIHTRKLTSSFKVSVITFNACAFCGDA